MTGDTTIYLDQLPNQLSLEATTDPEAVDQVEFIVNDSSVNTEGKLPYAINGDNKGNFNPYPPLRNVKNSPLKIEAIPTTNGKVGTSLEIVISIKESQE